ncbi:MAG: hypothetical protein WBC06_05900 [Chitinophagaceae bacterium]
MKKIIRNNRIIAIALLTAFSVAAAPSAFATEKNPTVPVTMSFIGNINEQPVFQLTGAGSATQNEFTIVIRDEYGNSLYWENIKAENFTKKFVLNTDEIGDETLYFEIFCRNTKSTVKYTVNRHTRQVQEIMINEVK